MEALLAEQAARTTARRDLGRAHPKLEQVSPDVGMLDEEQLAELLADDPDEAASMLADLARATDPLLRRKARSAAARLLIPPPRSGAAQRGSGASKVARGLPSGMDLDIDATIARLIDAPSPTGDDLRWQGWSRPSKAYVVLIDASGSVTGRPLATAVTTAAAVATRLRPGDELAVLAFWSRAIVLRHVASQEPPSRVLDRLFDLRGGDTTNLATGLRAALGQAGRARASRREVLVLTDGLANEGGDPLEVAAGAGAAGSTIHVLGLSDAADATAASIRLAGAGGGRWAPLLRPGQAAEAVGAVLAP